MRLLYSIIEKYKTKKKKKSTAKTFDLIEQTINFKLPDDYKSFATQHTNFQEFIGSEFVRLWNIDDLIEYNKDYGIIDTLNNIIGIGSNGGGEFIAIEKIKKNKYRIILSPYIDFSKENHIKIGDSFTDFLTRLENGIEWFQ